MGKRKSIIAPLSSSISKNTSNIASRLNIFDQCRKPQEIDWLALYLYFKELHANIFKFNKIWAQERFPRFIVFFGRAYFVFNPKQKKKSLHHAHYLLSRNVIVHFSKSSGNFPTVKSSGLVAKVEFEVFKVFLTVPMGMSYPV